ncbi:hypothetical protein CANINC_000560, partial [Pichia inconspicua]
MVNFTNEDERATSGGTGSRFPFRGNEPDAVYKARSLLTKLDLYFQYQETSGKPCIDIFRVLTAVNHLDGPALRWYMTRFPENPSWNNFRAAFVEEFCPTDELEIRSAAAKYNGLSQGNRPVEAYIREFEKYRSLLPANYEMEGATRDRFIQSLKPSLRNKVFQSRPETFAEAKFLARDVERNSNFYNGPPSQFFRGPYPDNLDNRGEPMEIDTLRAKHNNYDSQARQSARNYNYNDNNYRNTAYNTRSYKSSGRNNNGSNNRNYNDSYYKNDRYNNARFLRTSTGNVVLSDVLCNPRINKEKILNRNYNKIETLELKLNNIILDDKDEENESDYVTADEMEEETKNEINNTVEIKIENEIKIDNKIEIETENKSKIEFDIRNKILSNTEYEIENRIEKDKLEIKTDSQIRNVFDKETGNEYAYEVEYNPSNEIIIEVTVKLMRNVHQTFY